MKHYSIELCFTEEESEKLAARALALNIDVKEYIKFCCLIDDDTTESPITFPSLPRGNQKRYQLLAK